MDRTLKILVIDDDEIIRTLAERILQRAGYDVETAESGAAGIEAFSTDPDSFALILIDESMSGMTGQATLSEIRQIRPGFPGLISSGHGMHKSDILPELQENTWLLGKPYQSRLLRETVDSIVRDPSGKKLRRHS